MSVSSLQGEVLVNTGIRAPDKTARSVWEVVYAISFLVVI